MSGDAAAVTGREGPTTGAVNAQGAPSGEDQPQAVARVGGGDPRHRVVTPPEKISEGGGPHPHRGLGMLEQGEGGAGAPHSPVGCPLAAGSPVPAAARWGSGLGALAEAGGGACGAASKVVERVV